MTQTRPRSRRRTPRGASRPAPGAPDPLSVARSTGSFRRRTNASARFLDRLLSLGMAVSRCICVVVSVNSSLLLITRPRGTRSDGGFAHAWPTDSGAPATVGLPRTQRLWTVGSKPPGGRGPPRSARTAALAKPDVHLALKTSLTAFPELPSRGPPQPG